MKNTTQVHKLKVPSGFCPVNCAIAETAIKALERSNSIADLQDLNHDISNLADYISECLEDVPKHETRALFFALNLVKDLATTKAIAIARNH